MDKLLEIQIGKSLNLVILDPPNGWRSFAKRESRTFTNNGGSIGWFDWLRNGTVEPEIIGVRLYADMLDEVEKRALMNLKPWASISTDGHYFEIMFRLGAHFEDEISCDADLGFSAMRCESSLGILTLYFQIDSTVHLSVTKDSLIE